MKKIYIFSLSGIIHAIDEEGRSISKSESLMFSGRPKHLKEWALIEGFEKFTEMFKNGYTVVRIIGETDKIELLSVIQKLVGKVRKGQCDTSGIEYWEKILADNEINRYYFDEYNKDIWKKIS